MPAQPLGVKALRAIIPVLKKRFNNLTAEELVNLAADIIEAIEKQQEVG